MGLSDLIVENVRSARLIRSLARSDFRTVTSFLLRIAWEAAAPQPHMPALVGVRVALDSPRSGLSIRPMVDHRPDPLFFFSMLGPSPNALIQYSPVKKMVFRWDIAYRQIPSPG